MGNVNLLSRRSLKKVKTIAGQLWKKSSQLNSISNGYLYVRVRVRVGEVVV